MDAELLFTLICCFILYLPIQSLIINGIYISAAGKSETLPDGTVADSEMILYPLYKFLNQQYQKRIYFTLEQIKARSANLPGISGGTINWDTGAYTFKVLPSFVNSINVDSIRAWAEAYLSGKIDYDPDSDTIAFYQDETFYKFSKYLRKPIITCIICMASFWCILLFLIPVVCLFGFQIKILPIWIANTFCVSYLNYVIFKPRK